VRTDDLLKESPQIAPLRPAVGIAPQLSDAGLVTLAVLQALLGFTSEARWIRHAGAHLGHLFPYLPQQPGFWGLRLHLLCTLHGLPVGLTLLRPAKASPGQPVMRSLMAYDH
jgi:hypothetical protein